MDRVGRRRQAIREDRGQQMTCQNHENELRRLNARVAELEQGLEIATEINNDHLREQDRLQAEIKRLTTARDEFSQATIKGNPPSKGAEQQAREIGEEIEQLSATPDGFRLVRAGALQMVVNALRRDAAEGKKSRGEMVDELLAPAPGGDALAGSGGWMDHADRMERESDYWRHRAQTMSKHQQGHCWYWQGDGGDHLESMVNSLPVVIRADQLSELITAATSKDAQMPIDMVLHCPRCGLQHIDAPERDMRMDYAVVAGLAEVSPGYEPRPNPPCRSHQCHNPACGCIWRPADVPTNGVERLATRGQADNWPIQAQAEGGQKNGEIT